MELIIQNIRDHQLCRAAKTIIASAILDLMLLGLLIIPICLKQPEKAPILYNSFVRLWCQIAICPPGYYPEPRTEVDVDQLTCRSTCLPCDTNSFMEKFTISWGSKRTTCRPKRACLEESGLITKDHGSATTDATCQCDLSRGFYDPTGSENPTFCASPKQCPKGEELAPDGSCVSCPRGWFKAQSGVQRCQMWQSCEQRGMKTTRIGTSTQDCQCHPWDVFLHKVPFEPDRWCRAMSCPKGYCSVPCEEDDPVTTACEPCPPGEYMPHITVSTQGEKCRPKRACPKELGLVTVDKGSSITDATCKCDLDRGFYGTVDEVNPASCVGPKECPEGEELASNGSCVSCPHGWVKAQQGTNSTSIENQQKDVVSGLLEGSCLSLHGFARDVQTISVPVLEGDQSGTQNCRCKCDQTAERSGTVWWHFFHAVGPLYFSTTRTTADTTVHELYVGPTGIIIIVVVIIMILLLCFYCLTMKGKHFDKITVTNVTVNVKTDNRLWAANNLGCTSNYMSVKQSQFGSQNTMNVSSANGAEDTTDTFSVASEDSV